MPTKKSSLSMIAGVLLLSLVSCDGGSPTEPEVAPRPLPLRFALTGSATSEEEDGTSVSCFLDLHFELAENPRLTPGALEYTGVHGGSIRRTVLDAEGNGISLWPDVYGNVVARSIAPSSLQIEIPVNADAEGRFWRELSSFRGTLAPDGTATGHWSCAPFDIASGGYVDTSYTARGSWTLVAESQGVALDPPG